MDLNFVVMIEIKATSSNLSLFLVEVTGFEPATSCSQSRRATNCATPRSFFINLYFSLTCLPLLCSPFCGARLSGAFQQQKLAENPGVFACTLYYRGKTIKKSIKLRKIPQNSCKRAGKMVNCFRYTCRPHKTIKIPAGSDFLRKP